MKVLIRVDANLHMGSGHVMRCLTLAKALRSQGYLIEFACIQQRGDLINFIEGQGFPVFCLKANALDSSEWLPWPETTDFDLVNSEILEKATKNYDWVIVDHYGLSKVWHEAVRAHCKYLLVIDDLANRSYSANLLLDQNLGREIKDYEGRTDAHVLAGVEYSMLRDDFRELRATVNPREKVRSILVALGGVDEHNYTRQVLESLADNENDAVESITVVLGKTSPHKKSVEGSAKRFKGTRVEVLHGIPNMAEVMQKADLAIGAAGTTSWERCCMGLPTIMLELADNQRVAALALENAKVGVRLKVGEIKQKLKAIVEHFLEQPRELTEMSIRAMELVDGSGVQKVMQAMSEVERSCK